MRLKALSPFILFPFQGLSLLLGGTICQGAVLRSLDETHVIEAPISQHELTRIAVKDDRILNVFGLANEYVLEADEDQGQVFIRPTGLGHKPINLTLTTEGGHTQDLRLIPQSKEPEALILTHNTQALQASQKIKSDLLPEKQTLLSITRDEIETLLEACQEGRIPLGYKLSPLDLQTLGGSYGLIREIKGEKLRGLTYEVQNISQAPLVLSEPEFAESWDTESQNIIAILMPKKVLNPGERSFVYVVAQH